MMRRRRRRGGAGTVAAGGVLSATLVAAATTAAGGGAYVLSITGAPGTRYEGRCTLATAAGETVLELSGVVPRREELAGEGLACRIEAHGPLTVEIARGGSRSVSTTSGGVVNIAMR